MQIKTCQDCDQLRPFTVKRTCPTKNRANSDIIESFLKGPPDFDNPGDQGNATTAVAVF